ncbi:hypothetical protein [Mesobacillus maritimus]|uniref:hypothetical protein n=1 Tax=Mesobacillus maritimus TaxID=1643336 RepID=UPI00384E0E0F
MLVGELYLESIRLDQCSLVHYLYHLLAERKISLNDHIDQIDLEQADHQKVVEMIQNNHLGIRKLGIYSLKRNAKDFVFIYAYSDQEAIEFFTETFWERPLNCHEYPLDFELARGNGVITFREMKKEFGSFPVVAGYFTRGE